MSAASIISLVNGYDYQLPNAPEFIKYLQSISHGSARLGEWSLHFEGQYTDVAIYERPVYYDDKIIGMLTAREGKWLAYEGRIPLLSRPEPERSGKKMRIRKFADPRRQSVNLVYILNIKGNRSPRRDGWSMVPFP